MSQEDVELLREVLEHLNSDGVESVLPYLHPDFEFSTDAGKLGELKFGKIKEPFVYEMVGDAANLQQQERALNPFFASRGIGLRLTKPFANDSMSWSVGWFNDWWVQDQNFKSSGNDFVARLTGVPYFADDGSNYLHLGIGVRSVGADEGTPVSSAYESPFRFAGKISKVTVTLNKQEATR